MTNNGSWLYRRLVPTGVNYRERSKDSAWDGLTNVSGAGIEIVFRYRRVTVTLCTTNISSELSISSHPISHYWDAPHRRQRLVANVRQTTSPVATGGGFGRPSPKRSSKPPPKLKRETINNISRVFVNVYNIKPPLHKCKAPLLKIIKPTIHFVRCEGILENFFQGTRETFAPKKLSLAPISYAG